MYSIIVPTCWCGKQILTMLPKMANHPLVDEILLFNNNPRLTPPNISQIPKLKVFNNGRNNFVNPCWNAGVANAANDRCLLYSDDVEFDIRLLDWMAEQDWSGGFMGPDDQSICLTDDPRRLTDGPLSLVAQTDPTKHGYEGWAYLLFLSKNHFVPIPQDLLVYYGDYWLWELNWKQGRPPRTIKGLRLLASKSTTITHADSKLIGDLQHASVSDYHNAHKYLTYVWPDMGVS